MTQWVRAGIAALTATVIVGAVGVALATRVPDIIDRPLSPEHLGFAGVPIELTLSATAAADGTRQAQVPMHVLGDPEWLSGTDEIHIAFATFVTTPALRAAELRDASGRCRFTADIANGIRNNAVTRFVNGGECRGPVEAPLVLHLHVGPQGRVALWTFDVAKTDPVPEGLALTATQTHDRQHVLRGRVVQTRAVEGPRRAALVAFVWTGDQSARWVWGVLAGLWAIIGLSAWRLGGSPGPGIIGAATALAFAASALWAVVVPPLQGADEPDHLLSYAEITGRTDFRASLEHLARRTHFERIRFHWPERIRPMDVLRPAEVAWTANIHSERMDQRSPLGVALWLLADATVARHDSSAAALLWRLRLFNAVVFALAVGVATTLVTRGGASHWRLLGLAAIPSLAYFGMAFSDWAFVAAGAVMLAGALVAIVDDLGPSWLRGLALGGSCAWLVAASISGLALMPLLAAVLVGRLVLGPTDRRGLRDTGLFWAGITAGLAAGLWISGDLLATGYARSDQTAGSGKLLFDTVNSALGALAAMPWLLLTVPVIAVSLELAVTRLRRLPDVVNAGHRLVVGTGGLLALALLAVLVVSAFTPLPTLRPMEILAYATTQDYVTAVATAFTTQWRLTNLDHLMFSSFWSGFGWIDTILPQALLIGLALCTSLGLVVWLAHKVTTSAYRPLAWGLACLVGTGLALLAFAVAGAMMNRNVHGRYLIGVYVPLIVLAWQGWVVFATHPGWAGLLVKVVAIVSVVALQAFVFVFVLGRYY